MAFFVLMCCSETTHLPAEYCGIVCYWSSSRHSASKVLRPSQIINSPRKPQKDPIHRSVFWPYSRFSQRNFMWYFSSGFCHVKYCCTILYFSVIQCWVYELTQMNYNSQVNSVITASDLW